MYKLLLFILLNSMIFPQVTVSKISETSEQVQYKIKISQVELPDISFNFDKRESDFYDYSRTGELVLPNYDLYIIIPAETIKDFSFEILSENSKPFSPAINPARNKVNDSTYILDFNPPLKNTSPEKKLIEFQGYFRFRGNKVAHYKINPFRFSQSQGKLFSVDSVLLYLNPYGTRYKINSENKSDDIDREFLHTLVNPEDYNKYIVPTELALEDSTSRWIDFNREYLKIGVGKDGIYRITGNDLLSNGVILNTVNSSSFKLQTKGQTIPIYVNDNGNSVFDPEDYIEFLGIMNYGSPNYRTVNPPNTSYYEYLDRNSDTTIYWLSWGWNENNSVNLQSSGQLVSNDTLSYHTHLIHSESQVNYNALSPDPLITELPFWNDKKSWYGQPIFVGTQTFSFTANNIQPGQPVNFYLKYASLGGSINTNAHQLGFRINNNPVNLDSQNVNAYDAVILRGSETSDSLVNGTNRLIVQNYQNGNISNILYSDWYEVEYPRKNIASADSGVFRFGYIQTEGVKSFRIESVNTDSLIIWSLKNGVYKKIYGIKNGSSVIVTDTVNSSIKYFFDNALTLNPLRFYYKKRFKNIREQADKVDYLLVTAKPLMEASVQHAEYIASSENLKVKVTEIDDIIDEFAFGQTDPEALRSFVRFAIENWPSPAPSYLFLVGQANFDLKRNVTRFSNVPSKTNLVFTYGAPGSDNAFGIFDTTGAYINQILIGRLPARTAQDVLDYTNTLRKYNSQRFTEWNKNALLFSGGNFNDPNQIEQFRSNNQSLADTLFARNPFGMGYTHFYKTANPATSLGPYTPEQVKSAIDKGGLLFSYVGHSGVQTWDNGIGSPEQLFNSEDKNPLVTDFGCATGLHSLPDVNSFSELFMLSPRSKAIAYIANSSLGFVSTSATAPSLFYSTILIDSVFKISEALKITKQKLNDRFGSASAIKIFGFSSTFFGEPTLKIAIPGKPNFVISGGGLQLSEEQPDDLTDSVQLVIRYKNSGSVVSDSFKIQIAINIENTNLNNFTIKRPVPSYKDSLIVYVPVNKRAGNYRVEVKLNSDDTISELYSDDNSALVEFQVFSTEFRTSAPYVSSFATNNNLFVLNPRSLSQSSQLIYQISENPTFLNVSPVEISLGSAFSEISLNNLQKEKRYWLRLKNSNVTEFQNTFTFNYSDKTGFLFNDSLSFSSGKLEKLRYTNEGLRLDSLTKILKVESAGYYAGALGVIDVGGQNFVAENTIPGFHFCTFNRSDLAFDKYKVLAYNANTQQVNEIVDFLNGIDSTKLLVGVVSVTATRFAPVTTILQNLGSKFVQNVGYRHSWAFLTWRGAAAADVKEVWKTSLAGPASFDTSFAFNFTKGTFESEIIGPVKKWNYITFAKKGNFDGITPKLVGIRNDNTADTLTFAINSDSTSLSGIDPKIYSRMRLLISLENLGTNPALNSVRINSELPAELSLNNYNLSLSKDTIQLNDSLSLYFNLYNSGLSNTDSFRVNVVLENPDQSTEPLLSELVSNISPGQFKAFSIVINSNQKSGVKKLKVTIDPQNYVPELYEDNNTAEISFTEVLGFDKPYVRTQFNGQDIYDGDYVSNKPEITIDLYDPSTSGTVDTTLIRLLLNNRRIFLNSPDVTFTLRNTNPRVSLSYMPTLAAGEYELKVTGTGASGTPIDSAGSVKNFVVSDENKILQVFNYPNPFVNETYFTFKATNLPDEVQILIYTVAGRMIKKITKTAGDLRYDFNRIYWDGRDEDGDLIASGTYLYRVIMKKNGESQTVTEKLSVVR